MSEPMLLTRIADDLVLLAVTINNDRMRERVKVAAKVLRRRAEQVGDEVCKGCGCGELDACWDEEKGGCAWAESGLCTACAEKHQEAAG